MGKKAKGQLPSGNFRVRVLDYTDADGKRHYQSFTAESKKKAQAMAAEWKLKRKNQKERITVYDACAKYIELKAPILSPSTIRGYDTILRKIKEYHIATIQLRELTNTDIQAFVSELSISNSVKYVKNIACFISATLKYYMPDFVVRVQYPQKTHSETYTPSFDDVQRLLNACDRTEDKLAVLFGAIGFMRRSEACAVRFEDIDYKARTISIRRSFVYTRDNIWELKEPKTYESFRTVSMPEYVFDLIRSLPRKKGYILNMDPKYMYKRFCLNLEKAGLPHFRYHDLRHHAASYAHALGISERYTEQMGGWKQDSPVLRRVYQNVIDLEMEKAKKTFLEHQSFSV